MENLESLVEALKKAGTDREKLAILEQKKLEELPILKGRNIEGQIVIRSLQAIGEAPYVFRDVEKGDLDSLLQTLIQVEQFYRTIGGIVGYHATVMRLIREKQKVPDVRFSKPVGVNLDEDSPQVRQAIRWGIEDLPQMAEIYPVGGAGDRLDLRNEKTGEPLPAAQLMFCGRTLLQGLIRDLIGREYLYFKLTGRRVITPIVMMTSEEKDNDCKIKEICEKNHWFGRPRETFFIFKQPLIPVITAEGHWSMSAPLKLTLKPGGHGVIWKLANDTGVFDWLSEKTRSKALLRQINNPVAGTDQGLLAFTGIGCHEDKAFGFASCYRLLRAAEGMNVLVEREVEGGYEYKISNIEYTDFEQKGIRDEPETEGSPYSKFPSNTNILFVDLAEARKAMQRNPIPGMLINLKKTAQQIDLDGNRREVKAARLESTMQNISDEIVEMRPKKLPFEERANLKTFLTFNRRKKTISVTKRRFEPEKPIQETPEGCFYQVMQNGQELLKHSCGFQVPEVGTEEEYLQNGPNVIFIYHPALGPLYSVISQKVRRGEIADGSELQLEIAEADIENLHLDGSLLVHASLEGKCSLKNVRVKNRGINRSADHVYWKNQIDREEALIITIEGNGEFHAENVVFEGDHEVVVPDKHRMVVEEVEGELRFVVECIAEPTWEWNYSFDEEDRVRLSLQ